MKICDFLYIFKIWGNGNMLELKNLNKLYGKKVALKDFSYLFENGIYGLLGASTAWQFKDTYSR